jgi:hypothetical protein
MLKRSKFKTHEQRLWCLLSMSHASAVCLVACNDKLGAFKTYANPMYPSICQRLILLWMSGHVEHLIYIFAEYQ